MATGKRQSPSPSGGSPPGARRGRPLTIELEATELARGPVPTQPPDQGVAENADVAPGPAAEQPAETVGHAASPSPPSEPPRNNSAAPGVGRSGIAWLPPGMPWPLVGAGAVGAGAVLLLALLLWVAGLLPRSQDPMVAVSPRLNTIETQLRELAARPQPTAVDPKAIDELRARLAKIDPKSLDALTARLAKIETALAAPRTPVTDTAMLDRLTATDDAVKALAANVAQLTHRLDAVAAALAELHNATRASGADRNEIAALANKIAALEQTNLAIRDEFAKRAVASASDRAVRLAVLASALRGAVERGEPFAAELAAVKPLATDGATFGALEPFAAKGVPSKAALGHELAALIEPMRRAAVSALRDSGFIDRLQANAEKLVRIHPVGEVQGDTPAAILSRIELKAAHADIDGALVELAKLPANVRAPAQSWIARTQARQAAIAAANHIAAGALAALKINP